MSPSPTSATYTSTPKEEQYREDQFSSAKRSLDSNVAKNRQDTTASEAETHYKFIQNETCVMTPEVIMGPYVYPVSQMMRTDMSEDQPGVPLTLDIAHCNATGDYSSFEQLDENLTFQALKAKLGLGNVTYGLRGMYPTNQQGLMEMRTVLPGFYAGRAIHVHAQVFTNWTPLPNGTMRSGDLASTGQLYFDEALVAAVMAIRRTGNDVDKFIGGSMEGGYSPFVAVEPAAAAAGGDVTKGMVGYITLGVDTTHLSRPPNYIRSRG
ncbi:hypothetical protein PG999_000115 [Apiospora kogelbergensis]|uniref:Dioxygenase n=1 Tax=Apiospora kogelbergensis TaxID=1337665 RepID=A0AAW0RAJ9_9PEZI